MLKNGAEKMAYNTVKSVTKAITILELLTSHTIEDKALTLAEISEAAGILPVTARNLLRTLEECGYAERVGHGKYREGDRCLKLFRGEGILRRLKDVAKPIIDRTVFELGESLLLVAIVNNRRIELIRSKALDDNMLEPQWDANARFYNMRTTRAILAWYSEEELNEFITANGLPNEKDWPEAANSRDNLDNELKKIRENGGCCEIAVNYAAIAVPILTTSGEVVASLGCYSKLSRTDRIRATGIQKILQDCVSKIQQKITS